MKVALKRPIFKREKVFANLSFTPILKLISTIISRNRSYGRNKQKTLPDPLENDAAPA
jgi:hypothetical protein